MRFGFEKLADEDARAEMGRRIETFTNEGFDILRWSFVVGFTRFLAKRDASLSFDIIYWIASAMLFGSLASRFLLRPEIRFFRERDRRWKRVVQTTLNLGLCVAAFAVAMLLIEHLLDGIARYRFGPIES